MTARKRAYLEYLRSEHWRKLREQALERKRSKLSKYKVILAGGPSDFFPEGIPVESFKVQGVAPCQHFSGEPRDFRPQTRLCA